MQHIGRRRLLKTGIAAGVYLASASKIDFAAEGDQAALSSPPARPRFVRLLDSWWHYADPDYLAFVDEVQPEVVQVGFYGVDFWALAHVPRAVKGKTASLHAVDGDLKASGEFLENLNKELHQRGIQVVGHMDVEYHVTGLIDEPQGPREGFFKFYNELWDENELGPKPVPHPLDLLERKADGTPFAVTDLPGYSPWPLYHGCLNNPHWRAVLKAFVKRAIGRGVDGLVANYFYMDSCVCKYCVRGFKEFLSTRYSPAELRRQFGIEDLERFLVTEITDWYTPGQMTPLRLEGLRYSDIARKRAFDEVFVKYGRSLKPDLKVAQWVHSHVPKPSDSERFMLPAAHWGRDEDYFWYSLGTKTSNIMQLRYVRGAGGGRPFSGHYRDATNHVLMAEFCANGGAPNIYPLNFHDARPRQVMVSLFQFMKRHDDVYHASAAAGECVLLYPRSQFQQGLYPDAVAAYEAVGSRLLAHHILFDVLPDDLATPAALAKYKCVYTNSSQPGKEDGVYAGLSRFEAPATVRVSASRPEKGGVWDIHVVNYQMEELLEEKATAKIEEQDPHSVAGVKADLDIPAGLVISKIEWITPEAQDAQELHFQKEGPRVRFTIPEFSVYGVARVYGAHPRVR